MILQRPLTTLLAGGLLGALGGVAGAAWYISTRVTPENRRTYADDYTFTPWELDVPFEAVTFSTSDGIGLRGWWLPRAAPRGVVIGCHGHGGRKDDLLGIGAQSWRAGYAVLLFDFRGRGDSDPWPQTLISREVEDLRAAVAFAQARAPGARVGLVGFSMGAAVALLAAADEPAVAAVAADSAFTSGRDVVADGLRSVLRFSPEVLIMAADELAHRRHGYRFSHARPLDAVARIAPRPVLIIHGGDDSLVPVDHARRLYAAAGEPRQLWVVEGVEHCGAYFHDRAAYCRRVLDFFEQYLASLAPEQL